MCNLGKSIIALTDLREGHTCFIIVVLEEAVADTPVHCETSNADSTNASLLSRLQNCKNSMTYSAPSRNMPNIANLCCRGSCNFKTIGTGIPSIMKSIRKSEMQEAYHIETPLIQEL